MQRSSNTTSRNLVIGSVIIVLLISVLYYLKRVEVNHLKKNVDSLQVGRTKLPQLSPLPSVYFCRRREGEGGGREGSWIRNEYHNYVYDH